MKRLLALLGIVGVTLALGAGPALADGTIQWGGHGSDVLPCDSGGHWVLAPAFGIDSAVLTVNGVDYPMTQNGQGSWSADSVGSIDSGVSAFVTYTGAGDERDSLQLSHCIEGSPSPTSPPPTSPPPTSPPPTSPPPTSPPPSGCHRTHTCWTRPPHVRNGGSPKRLALTGADLSTPIAIGAVLLALAGGAFWLRRRTMA